VNYPPLNPPIGFRVPRMDEDGGGGGVATIAGAVVCFGVVTVAFPRKKDFEGPFDVIDLIALELS